MKNKKLYNYIVNTIGISKELILEQVNARVEDLLDKHVQSLLQSNHIERMIVNKLYDYIKTGKVDYWSRQGNFEKIVDAQVKNIIEEYLRDKCKITFQFQNNSVRFLQEDK
jgi:hypothetical protein